jgi:hypothetical protein
MEMRHVSRIVEGERLFHSTGSTVLRVTVNGKAELVSLPIRSVGIFELEQELEKSRPRPPVRKELVKRESSLGKKLGLARDSLVSLVDEANPEYREALRKWQEEAVWATVIQALDVEWVDAHGEPITDPERIKAWLVQSGITGHHLDQIARDVRNLTQRLEREADFLSGSA